MSIGLDSSLLRSRLRIDSGQSGAPQHSGILVESDQLTVPGVWADLYHSPSTELKEAPDVPDADEVTEVVKPTAPQAPVVKKLDFTAPSKPAKQRRSLALPRPSLSKLRPKKRNFMSNVLVVLAVMLLMFGFSVTIHTFILNRQIEDKVSAAPSEVSGEPTEPGAPAAANGGPEETRPTNLASYSVPADQPKFVKILKFNTTARIKAMGVDANNKLIAPGNVHDAGWFQNSAKPGAIGGATLLDGHVSGWTTKGVFYRLKELVAGDQITIERGDGQVFTYKVVKSQMFDKNSVDMNSAMRPVNASKTGLNLITCAGSYDRGSDDYTHRLVVYAEAI